MSKSQRMKMSVLTGLTVPSREPDTADACVVGDLVDASSIVQTQLAQALVDICNITHMTKIIFMCSPCIRSYDSLEFCFAVNTFGRTICFS